MEGGDQPKSKRLRTSKEGRLILAIFVRASYMDDTTTIAETKWNLKIEERILL